MFRLRTIYITRPAAPQATGNVWQIMHVHNALECSDAVSVGIMLESCTTLYKYIGMLNGESYWNLPGFLTAVSAGGVNL